MSFLQCLTEQLKLNEALDPVEVVLAAHIKPSQVLWSNIKVVAQELKDKIAKGNFTIDDLLNILSTYKLETKNLKALQSIYNNLNSKYIGDQK